MGNRESRIEDRESKIENRESRIEHRGSRDEDQGSMVEDRDSTMEDRQSRVKDRKSKIENQGSVMEDRAWKVRLSSILYLLSSLLICSSALAAATQEEVFKSIQDNVGSSTDPKKFFAFLAGVAGLIILLAVLSNRKKREITPNVLNHQGKLLKEIMRKVDLRPAELRQLKLLAESQKVTSPLTLLLCPSVLAKAVKERGGKVDRKLVLSLARKLG